MPGSEEPEGSVTSFPQGMSIPTLPQAPSPVSDLEGGLQGAARVADTVGGAVTMATQISEAAQGASAEQVIPAILGGLGSALGGASTVASGIDPGVSQALGVISAGASLAGGAGGMMRSIVDAVRGVVAESNRHRVTFEFESGALEDAVWMVASFTLDERIGRPYLATIVLACEDLDVDARAMLGVNAKLTLRRGDEHERVIGGVVQRVELGRTTDRARMVTVELVPALALLALRKDSRIFQDVDATDILDAVVGGALEGYSREIELRTRRTYLRREYCVQYGETDLDFAHRLMEEEGITYFFEWQSDGTEKMVLVDGRDGFPSLLPDDESIPFVQQRGETSDTEHVHELLAATQLRTTSFALTDLDWTQARPHAVIDAHVHGEDASGRSREHYVHDRAVTYGGYEQKAYLRSDAEARLATRREAHAAQTRVLRGACNVIRLSPGRTVTIEDHPVEALDGELVILAVSHRGHAPELHDLLGNARYAADDVSYECSFEAIPECVPYRMPETTPKPRVNGVLSAIVVGADGQEIHSDEYRRVRIQMRWDREGTFDDRSSPFVRVMQSWAGNGFGAMFLPRVGMEVAVAFLDGDPDRPIVAGCLYNAEQDSPYKTEAEWTKSGFRTRSSPDRGAHHFNELTFDDAAGEEKVYLHAEKDLTEEVEHDHLTHVRRNQTNRVDVDQDEAIGGDQLVHVRGNRQRRVDHNEEITIDGMRHTEIGREDQLTVTGPRHEHVTGDVTIAHDRARNVCVGGQETETYRAGRDVRVDSFERLYVQGPSHVSIAGVSDMLVDVHHTIAKAGGAQLVVANGIVGEAPGDITLRVGENRIAISPNGDIRIHGTRLFLSNDAASIELTADGLTLACGTSSVSLTPTGVSTSATQISSTATADHTIQGAIVRIN